MIKGRLLQDGGTTTSGLPEGWESESLRRLQLAAWAATAGSLIALAASMFAQPNVGGLRDGHARPFYLVPVAFGLSLAMAVIARTDKVTPARRLDLGLIYLVLLCAVMSVFRHALPYEVTDVVRGPSPIAVAVLVFAMVIPVNPSRMAIAAAACALVDPLAFVFTLVQGNPSIHTTMWIWLFLPGTASALVAVVVSRLVYQLGRAVREAQDMGAYRLVERLGVGGMGEVWRATHRTLARPAAIKLIKPGMLGGSESGGRELTQQRFEREARATAMLSSPHTIDLYDFGATDDGTLYYVMELLDGVDLESLVQQEGPLPQARVVHFLVQLCDSLSEAHAQGLVHRDIKPANVYVCRKGRTVDFVKVLDFGLVKNIRSDDETNKLTSDNAVMGTPAYMPPEIALAANVDGRADIYALGCVAYWLLSGEVVFQADNPFQLVVKHVRSQPQSLIERADLSIDPALASIIERCLAKDPGDRYDSCDELADELRALGMSWSAAEAEACWADR